MGLPRTPSVAELMRLYRVTATKRLSQNFLLDSNVTDRFVRSAGDLTGKCVVEVGAGPGSLTRSILQAGAGHVYAVERDARFLPLLEMLAAAAPGRVTVMHTDVLEMDWGQLPRAPESIIGNLPFNIATPLLIRFLRDLPARRGAFTHGPCDLTLSFQHELAQRIVSPTGTRNWSRLSVMAQAVCEAKLVYRIPGRAFVPAPNVDVGVVRFSARSPVCVSAESFSELEVFVRGIFRTRRKTMRNNVMRHLGLSGAEAEAFLEAAQVDPQARSQDVGVNAFLRMVALHHNTADTAVR